MRVEELVGQRIREARERAGMSQPQLGEWLEPLLGRPLPRQAISLAEQGNRQFTAAELVAFAHVVGCSVGDLFALPIGVDSIEMPAGKSLTREDLRQAAASGQDSIVRLRSDAAELVAVAESMQGLGVKVEQTARRVHDDLGRVLGDLDKGE